MSRTTASVPAALLLALLLPLTGCSGGDDDEPEVPETAAAPSPTPPPTATTAPRPDDGACYRLAFEDALAATTQAAEVACSAAHTSTTVAVGTIDNVIDGHLLAVDSDRVVDSVGATCSDRVATVVGGTRAEQRLSMLRPVWFTPTVAQSDAGADWYRCDVIAVAGQDRLAPLPRRVQGVLSTPEGRTAWGMCGTDAPDSPAFERVLCSAPHSWRAVATVDFEPGPYPGEDAVRDRGQAPCEDAGREVAADALDFRWGYEWPTREQWELGQTYGRCWAPD